MVMNVLQDAVETNTEFAVFNSVSGNQYGDIGNPRHPLQFFNQSNSAPAPHREMHVLHHSQHTNARQALFNSVGGDQYSDATAAALFKTGRAPPLARPQGGCQRMDVMTGARETDVQQAYFNFVDGNQSRINTERPRSYKTELPITALASSTQQPQCYQLRGMFYSPVNPFLSLSRYVCTTYNKFTQFVSHGSQAF